MRGSHGFTLLELLMVVIIIAILASIALPQYIRASERARASQALTYLGALRSAEMRFAALDPTNTYTNTLTALDIDLTNPLDWGAATVTFTAGAAGVNPIGFAEMARNAGTYGGQTVGIQFGTGTICGNYGAYGAALAACVQD